MISANQDGECGRLVRSLRRRLLVALAWHTWCLLLLGWFFAAGSLLLVLRFLGIPCGELAWGVGIGGLLLAVPAGLVARRTAPGVENLTGWLDAYGGCGGLLIAGRAGSQAGWKAAVPAVPRVGWRGNRRLAALLVSLAYVVLVVALPERLVGMPWVPRRLQLDAHIDDLTRQVEVLAGEELISEERAGEFARELERLLEENRADRAGVTWEALDRLADSLANEAANEAAAALKELAENARTASVAEALAESAAGAGGGQFDEAAEQFAEYLREAAEKNAALKEFLDKLAAQAGEGAGGSGAKPPSLTPEEMKQLAEALARMNAEQLATLQALQDVRLIPAEQLEQCRNAGQTGAEAALAWLQENGGQCDKVGACLGADSAAVAALLALSKPGAGGVSRGPGAAALGMTGGSDESGAAFKDQTIEPARLDFEKSQLTGLSLAAPSADDAGEGSAGGALGDRPGGDSASTTYTILPRHQAAVENYFKRDSGDDD